MANTGRVHTARLRNGDNIMKKSKKNNNFKDTSETKSKKEKNYRIIRIDENGKKVTMVRFWAPDDKGALTYLTEYKKVANKAYKYYWDYYRSYYVLSKDGKTVKKYDEDTPIDDSTWYSKLWDNILWYSFGWWLSKLNDLRWWFADMLYFAKHKQYRRASWSLDTYILKTLKHNVNVLIKTKHGISPVFIDEARKILHKNDKNFDVKKYSAKHVNTTPEEEKLSLELQNKSFKQLVSTIDRYNYYFDIGCTDDKALDKELRSTLPVKQGSYDVLDYDKLYIMQQKQWNKIWEWMKLNGQTLWD